MTTYDPAPPSRRSGLQKTRDIALIVMATLVSIVCLLLLYVSVAAGSALEDFGNRLDSTPTPAVTLDLPTGPTEVIPTNSAGEECIGEELPAGC